MTKNKGFTLVELLIVIGILAVLSTATVLILNPAQILAETRDTQRLNDLSTVSNAIALYLATATAAGAPDMDGTVGGACLTAWSASTSALASTNQPFANPAIPVASFTLATPRAISTATVSGWVPIILGDSAGGSPMAVLPTDPSPVVGPLSTTGRFYAYQCDNTAKKFELNAGMESLRYSTGGGSDAETPDGGSSNAIYEVGSNLSL